MNLFRSDCLAVLKSMEPNSVDSIVTDPPYGISILGEKWDKGLPTTENLAGVFQSFKARWIYFGIFFGEDLPPFGGENGKRRF